MNGKEINEVRYRIEEEGIDYTFLSYSNYEEIKDEEFHRLRLAFVEATKNLKKYIFLKTT